MGIENPSINQSKSLNIYILADAQVANNPACRLKYANLTERLAAKIATYEGSVDKLAYLRGVANIFSG